MDERITALAGCIIDNMVTFSRQIYKVLRSRGSTSQDDDGKLYRDTVRILVIVTSIALVGNDYHWRWISMVDSIHSIWQTQMLLAGFARLAMRALGGEEDCLPMSNILSALDGHDDATDLCIAGTKMDESCNSSRAVFHTGHSLYCILCRAAVESASSFSCSCVCSLQLITVCRHWQPAVMSSTPATLSV